jgi:peptidoglycan/xylan/chitin deacetylase (PgdA/CDA1 family)
VRPGARAARDVYAVEPAQLARQLALLRRLGYRPIPLEALVAMWGAGALPPPRAVAITFDDGYRDNLTHAWPVLRRFGCPATVFVVTGRAGGVSLWDTRPGAGRRPLLTWDELRRLDGAGFRAGAHTHTHADLTRVAPADAEAELRLCREALAAQLGRSAPLFAYPYGHNTAETQAQVAAAGFQAAFSVRHGLNTLHTPRYDHRRIEIRGEDSLLRFAIKLWTGDDPVRYLPGWGRWERARARMRGGAR